MAVSTWWFINKAKKDSRNTVNLTEKKVHLTRVCKLFNALSNIADFPEFDFIGVFKHLSILLIP